MKGAQEEKEEERGEEKRQVQDERELSTISRLSRRQTCANTSHASNSRVGGGLQESCPWLGHSHCELRGLGIKGLVRFLERHFSEDEGATSALDCPFGSLSASRYEMC